MSDNSAQGTSPGLHQLRFDRRLLSAAEFLAGSGLLLWAAGCVVGFAALRRAAQDWIEQLDRPPSELAINKWQQLLHAATAGANAYHSGARSGS